MESYWYSLWLQKGLFENKSLEVASLTIRSAISAAIFMAHSFYKDNQKALEQALKVLKDKNERDFIVKSLVPNEEIAIRNTYQLMFLDESANDWKETELEKYAYQKMIIDANNYLNSIDNIEEAAMYLQLRMLEK